MWLLVGRCPARTCPTRTTWRTDRRWHGLADDAPFDEAELLMEIARLTAALIRVVVTIDDEQLKREVAALIWPLNPPGG